MRKKVAALASAAAATMLIGGAGLASASAHPAGPAVSGTEHLYLMTTSATSNKAAVIVDGLFTAGGTDLMGNTVDKIVLPGGTFKVHHPGNSGKPKVNPLTCLFTLKQAGLRFTVSGGTGRYKGITGSGRAALSIIAVLGRNSHGKCSYSAKPQGWQQTITATGHVSL